MRFLARPYRRPWLWRAETLLCNDGGLLDIRGDDYSDLLAQLGGWMLRTTHPDAPPAETLGFAQINADGPGCQLDLYGHLRDGSGKARVLVGRKQVDGRAYEWTTAGGDGLTVFYLVGELIERSDSRLTIRWRELSGGAPDCVFFPRASIVLDPGIGLKLRWGPLADTLAGAAAPATIPVDAPCSPPDAVCYGRPSE